MNVQILSFSHNDTQISFKNSFVTLSKQNLGEKICKDVVHTYNEKMWPNVQPTVENVANKVIAEVGKGSVIAKASDLIENVNYFVLGAGKGSRFQKFADIVAKDGKGPYNKISLPVNIEEAQPLHMLDVPMVQSKFFTEQSGIKPLLAETSKGSFAGIINYYLKNPNEIKDTIVCCGDNVFDESSINMLKFWVKNLNNPNKHLALVGVERTPDEVAKRFGVLKVAGVIKNSIVGLSGFVEKPELKVAESLAQYGKNIANTGMFYMSKEALTKLVKEIRGGINNIQKNDLEIYDFAKAIEYVHKNIFDWFGIEASKGSDVKVVKKWEDVGEFRAFVNWLQDVAEGNYLKDFISDYSIKVKKSIGNMLHLKDTVPYMNFTNKTVSLEQVKNAEELDGIKVIV